jgi:magnesium transporter
MQDARRDAEAMARGMGGLVHRVLDETVDSYFPVLDKLVEQVEDVQQFAFVGDGGPGSGDAMRPLFKLKKGLFALRRVMAPQADALRVLAREGVSFYEEPDRTDFEDVFDRAVRVEQTILMNQELLINARESYLTRVSNELGVATQALLVVTCLILVPLFVGAFYGMNFQFIPESHWPLGHSWPVILIVAIDGGLLYFFHRQRWT